MGSQADLSLGWAHRSVCFVVLWLSLILFLFLSSQGKVLLPAENFIDSIGLLLSRIVGSETDMEGT